MLNIDLVSEEEIAQVVPAFYAKVRKDPMLGPIFNDAIDEWPEHLEKLQAFWSSVMHASGRYKGQPMPAHVKHASRITPDAFTRWLQLWGETTDELLPPDAAAAMQDRAQRIAESLSLGIQFYKDRLAEMKATAG